MIVDRRLLLGSALTSLSACATGASLGYGVSIETFDVWPGAPPGGEGVTVSEVIIERATVPGEHDRVVTGVSRPTLTVFRPANSDGSAVLVIPGGGYRRVVLDKEGDETALFLARHGVAAAVLVYRLPGDGWDVGRDAPLQDAQRALRLLRSGRLAPGIDGARVGVIGFSAGGHLAASLALAGSNGAYDAIDAADAAPARPDFAALIYAAYLDGKGPPGLQAGFVGPAPDLMKLVDAKTQPMFLVHAADDATVKVGDSVGMYRALKAAGVGAELHVFSEGGHGFGIARARGLPVAVWPQLFLRWGRARGMFRG